MVETNRQRGILAAALCVLLIIAAAAVSRGSSFTSRQGDQTGNDSTQSRENAVPVATATTRSTNVDVYLTGLGTVIASNTVTVHSRVDGQLVALHFREGQQIKAGEPLADIDPRPFEVQV